MEHMDCRTPFGTLRILASGKKIARIDLVSGPQKKTKRTPPVLKKCAQELRQYFKGKRRYFSAPLEAAGTSFQKKVWSALIKIPYGKTKSYRDIALAIGKPRAVRAVAGAIGANPLCLIVPCHRVIGSDGSLTGYAYGLSKKAALLRLERVTLPEGL